MRTPSVRPCFIINCQLLIPFTSGPWLQKWDNGADTRFPAMKLMCQIMFYNQLPTSDTIHKWTLAPEVGLFHIGAFTDMEPGHWGRHQVSSHETDMSNHVYNQLPNSDTIHKWTLAPEVGRFHIGALTDVEPEHLGRHQVFGHGTDVSNHVL